MSTVWEVIKRNKGKVIAGGIIVSGIAAYILQMKEQHRHGMKVPDVCSQDAMKVQARRHYVFDTNHRACDQSITDIVPNIETLVQRRFDVETLIHRLKENPNLLFEEKVRIWDRVKVLSIARIIGIAYSYSLLILALKTQISILAADVCSQFERPQSNSWLGTAKSHMANYLGLNSVPSSTLSVDTSSIAANRKVFMECIQYFMVTGVTKLLDVVEDVCKQICSTVALTDHFNKDKMRDILNLGDRQLSMLDSTFYSGLVAPLTDEDRNSQDGVMKLLTGLVNSIESKKFRETLSSLVDFYLTAAVHKMPSEPVVFAKLLPSFPDAFHFISSLDFDSPLRNGLCSSDVHQYAMFVFKTI